ncbi:hypothetical protein NMY22_g19518 [Coprinellus aureogranulatus]|nr:hypothetical protein NMY22_g19518 [Coprinellus aureogranulatus]
MYTFLISRLTVTPPIQMPPPDLRRARKLRSMHAELEERKRRIARKPFPLMQLPPELCLLILQHAAESPGTVASLFLVSRRIQGMAYEACLPKVPIKLVQAHQVESFDRMLLNKPQLTPYIHHLWEVQAYHVTGMHWEGAGGSRDISPRWVSSTA